MQKQYFHGVGKTYPFFEGWYLKHQLLEKTFVFIPAVHADQKGKWSASLQVIVSDGRHDKAWYFPWSIKELSLIHI